MREDPLIEGELLVFGGSASPRLTAAICDRLCVPVGQGEVIRFSEGTLFVRIGQNVRGRHVFLVQSTVYPANDHFMEMLFWIDAFKRASASSVTVLMPYFSYAKGDKKDEPRVSIRARVCADVLEAAGADRFVGVDLHSPQIQGFFRVPVDDLQARPTLCDAIVSEGLDDPVVVSPDEGFVKRATLFAERLGAPLAICHKRRRGHDERAEMVELIGDVKNRTCLVVDDVLISGGTLVEVAEALIDRGAADVIAAVTHGVLSGDAAKRLEASPISRLYLTDTVENHPLDLPVSKKTRIVSVAPLLAEAIRRIHGRESISVLFRD
ncbi:MAG TPA: ribose-phosphate pyrophosphokinase [Candidatus Dormibacteraeota bacterium]|nr:ribose-phosphate pyrophosphokinase [Candidatus Dormibacteraeota bacterium]